MDLKICRISSCTSLTACCFFVLVTGLCVPAVKAQDIRIKVIDARKGRIVSDECVNVWVGKNTVGAILIPTDKDGVALLHLTYDDAKMRIPAKSATDSGENGHPSERSDAGYLNDGPGGRFGSTL